MNPTFLSLPLQVTGVVCRHLFDCQLPGPSALRFRLRKSGPLLFAFVMSSDYLFWKFSKSCREGEGVSILFYQQEMSKIFLWNCQIMKTRKMQKQDIDDCIYNNSTLNPKTNVVYHVVFLIIETVWLILQRNDLALFWLNTQINDSWFHLWNPITSAMTTNYIMQLQSTTKFNILVAFLWVVIFAIRIKWICSDLYTPLFSSSVGWSIR